MKIFVKLKKNAPVKNGINTIMIVAGALLLIMAILTRNIFMLLFFFAAIPLYSFFNKRSVKRLLVSFQQFPSQWRTFLKTNSFYYPSLNSIAKKRFERDVKFIITETRMRVKGGKAAHVSMDVRLFIAMGMATLLIGRPDWELPLPGEIIILPGSRMNKLLEAGSGGYAALATREALYLTEENLIHSFARSEDGYNIVFHEVAHYFDIEDSVAGGMPAYQRFGTNKKQRQALAQWSKVLETELDKAKNGEIHLRPQAIHNKGEFFACATEAFFEQPDKLKEESEILYNLLKAFYNFDPLKYRRTSKQIVTV